MTKSSNGEGDFLLGGQAVIEGVLMRSPNYWAVAVRKESGEVVVRRRHQPRITDRHPVLGWPVIRGVVLLGQALAIGVRALNFSAAVLSEEEDKRRGRTKKKSKFAGLSAAAAVALAVALAFALIVFLPLWLTDMAAVWLPALEQPLAYNLVDGVLRILIFIGYILLISLLPDIRRVFQYHGAEHMSVHAHDEGCKADKEDKAGGEGKGCVEPSVERARGHSPYHPRCGTSFLLLVMVAAILIFSLTPTRGPFWIRLLIRTPLIPLIAGVGYELLKLTSRLKSRRLFAILTAPGLWLQRLTARRPDDRQLAVAVEALRQVLELEERYGGGPIPAEQETALPAADT